MRRPRYKLCLTKRSSRCSSRGCTTAVPAGRLQFVRVGLLTLYDSGRSIDLVASAEPGGLKERDHDHSDSGSRYVHRRFMMLTRSIPALEIPVFLASLCRDCLRDVFDSFDFETPLFRDGFGSLEFWEFPSGQVELRSLSPSSCRIGRNANLVDGAGLDHAVDDSAITGRLWTLDIPGHPDALAVLWLAIRTAAHGSMFSWSIAVVSQQSNGRSSRSSLIMLGSSSKMSKSSTISFPVCL